MYKKNCNTRKWMYLCAVTGVMNLLAFIVCLYFQQWFISGIALLLTIRQAIVLPKWRKKKTGIFSGSFNPIHIGHLALANYLCEYEGLDEIWFMVSPQNPLKTKAELWSDELRLQLVELSISDYPRFRASDFEFHLPRPSYSVYTLEKLREAYPDPGFPVKEEELPETVRLVHSPVFEISSTFIREALNAGKDIRYFLHPRAWEAIKKDNIRL